MKIFEQLKESREGLISKLIILGTLGLIFILAGNFFAGTGQKESAKQLEKESLQIEETEYAEKMARELENTLSLIQGVGEVRVQLLITGEEKYEYEYNLNQVNKITNESDQNGGERGIEEDRTEKEMVIIRDQAGKEQPVIKKIQKPIIKGAIVVARGAENSQIRYKLYRAVASFLDLPGYKINILPYQRR